MRRIDWLSLPPGNCRQFRAYFRIIDNEEFPRLESERRRRKHEGLLKRRPVRLGDLPSRIEFLHSISPFQLANEFVVSDGFGVHIVLFLKKEVSKFPMWP